MVYYNEIDPYAAQWLRNLIAAGHIAEGDVDTRSIKDVRADDLRPYVQCHFFAGIGVWSHALRLAGWPDDRPVWTGSCPCQPFSAAGKGKGFNDERHLWPEFHRLINECRPPVVFGEQVASKDGLGWIDTVQIDMEASGYAIGAADLCAAGVGAPHIRQRLWFVGERLEHAAGDGRKQWRAEPSGRGIASGRNGGGLGNPGRPAGQRDAGAVSGAQAGEHGEGQPVDGDQPVGLEHAGTGLGWLADATGSGQQGSGGSGSAQGQRTAERGLQSDSRSASPTHGHWRDADWLFCRDGKWRPVEPGTFPLAHGATARMGRLRAYGNAIVPQVAQVFIEAYLDAVA